MLVCVPASASWFALGRTERPTREDTMHLRLRQPVASARVASRPTRKW